jgi:hypothetical protein
MLTDIRSRISRSTDSGNLLVKGLEILGFYFDPYLLYCLPTEQQVVSGEAFFQEPLIRKRGEVDEKGASCRPLVRKEGH